MVAPKLNSNGIPAFEDLPLRIGDPPHSAWGLYGINDELGTLNRLTDERVKEAAAAEISTGERVSLNLPLNEQSPPSNLASALPCDNDNKIGTFFGRKAFHQQMFNIGDYCANDEVWTFNSQVSSQWDGLRHLGYQRERVFYNGVTMKGIYGANEKGDKNCINGISAWSEKGIVGRGILLDYHSWRLKQKDARYTGFDAFSSYAIPLQDLKACLADQGTEVKFGDILIIRSGFRASYLSKSPAEIAGIRETGGGADHRFVGLEQSKDMLKWLWENFSAVGGDQPALEVWPTQKDWLLHEVLLAGWGCPIGEWFNLEALSEKCKEKERWSFFLMSEPCNVSGGVASPANMLAIF